MAGSSNRGSVFRPQAFRLGCNLSFNRLGFSPGSTVLGKDEKNRGKKREKNASVTASEKPNGKTSRATRVQKTRTATHFQKDKREKG